MTIRRGRRLHGSCRCIHGPHALLRTARERPPLASDVHSAPDTPPPPWLSSALPQAALRELWGTAFPGSPYPEGVPPKHPKWKEMGWQGDDPGTDFR